MAIEVRIPKEIEEYQEKILFGMSLRQLICFILAVILSIGTYFLCSKVFNMSSDATSYIIILETLPLMAIGFIRKDGKPFEKYIKLFIRHRTGRNKLVYYNKIDIDENEGSKYDWIFKKKNGARHRKVREANIYQETRKSKKEKRKKTKSKIKNASKEYQKAKRLSKKAAKGKISA